MLVRVAFLAFALILGASAQTPDSVPTIAEQTAGMRAMPGLFPLYLDAKKGEVWLEIPRMNEDFLLVQWLSHGMGYNPIGLDRAQLGSTSLVRFRRFGPKILLEEPNQSYRAAGGDADEARAVEESFATSVHWGAEIAAETEGRVLVDLTPLLLRDSHGISRELDQSDGGSFRPDPKRSAVVLDEARAFPQNIELESLLTFEGSKPGRGVRETTPTPEALTLHVRHSFVALPADGYQPRKFDPRAGIGSIEYADYSTPLDQPLVKRFIRRHRLSKQDPSAAVSAPVEPITYYLDRGAPEPVRSALLDGARWWNEAFEAAGYRDAFRVELLPEDADPLDLRYNIINWVHRSTRGWSYGASVVDPRTGEILKGVVTLGSLRVRQDRLLFEGLIPYFGPTKPAGPSPVEVALSRLRQLSAHEVGHTLGFAHNFATSSYGRESVMDYPAPLVEIAEGKLDLSNAYGVGIGEWDKTIVRYAYSDFPESADEDVQLEGILRDAHERGLLFVSDSDSWPLGAVHPLSSLWDNGDDPIEALRHTMEVRRIALENFGLDNIPPGTPLSELELWLTPLYLHHRYQVEATAKMLGGATFDYGLRGLTGQTVQPVPAAQQIEALKVLVDTLDPASLALPERIIALIPPPAYGYDDRRETIDSRSGRRFDPVAAARVAADVTLAALLEPTRAARLLEQAARDPQMPRLEMVLVELRNRLGFDRQGASDPWLRSIQLESQDSFLKHLMDLADAPDASPQVRAISGRFLEGLAGVVMDGGELTRFLKRPAREDKPAQPLPAPPGSPIGQ